MRQIAAVEEGGVEHQGSSTYTETGREKPGRRGIPSYALSPRPRSVHNRMVKSLSMDPVAIMFCMGCIYKHSPHVREEREERPSEFRPDCRRVFAYRDCDDDILVPLQNLNYLPGL
jgi:hypothetical protein